MNTAVWHGRTPRRQLIFPIERVVEDNQEVVCPIRVFYYTGHYESGSIPFEMIDANVADQAYVDSLILGRTLAPEQEEDWPNHDGGGSSSHVSLQEVSSKWSSSSTPGWERPCWPGNCGAGGGPWPQRLGTLIGGMRGRWKQNVVLPFYFDSNVDDGRKGAFRKAVSEWKRVTCIHFVETTHAVSEAHLKVTKKEKDHCYVSHIGYPGHGKEVEINLGWCDSERYVGNIVHELGHILGMNHEQKRPDAINQYHGHGPHLKVDWNVVGDEWADQYSADQKSYIGSKNDGADDPWTGYATYDFGSIMHYPAGDHFETIPAENARLTGNRAHLSAGDIRQILDTYQCKESR